MDPLLLLSGTELAARIRRRENTSREVVDAHIRRIEEVNPTLNAVVRDRFDLARDEARAADERTGDGDLPPFHGVPCTIKECFALTGMPQSSGVVARRDVIASKDATAVARLRAAGAIPLGVTNLSELCLWMETSNRVYGRTNNPYDASRIVGGSSGGEGAIVGAGGSPFGLGSDIGGSIRMPAFFCGVFGHKPSGGLVPGTGQFPLAENDALRYLTTGPIARRAEDLWPLLRTLAGPDGEDGGCVATQLGDPSTVRLEDLTVLTMENDGRGRVQPELALAQRRAAAALAERGAKIETVELEGFRLALDVWAVSMNDAGGSSFKDLLGHGQRVRPMLELLKWTFGGSAHTLPAIALAILEKAPELLPKRARRMVELRRRMIIDVRDRIGPNGVLLYPSYPTVAPRHFVPLLSPFKWAYTAIFNVLELPVTQVPLGLGPSGLPVGVQVVGTQGSDHVTIAAALALESALGGWVPPTTKVPSLPRGRVSAP